MGSGCKDQEIENILRDIGSEESDISDSDISKQELNNKRRAQHAKSVNSRMSRKRKASIDLQNDIPIRRTRDQPASPLRNNKGRRTSPSTPSSSPARKVTPRKSSVPPFHVEQNLSERMNNKMSPVRKVLTPNKSRLSLSLSSRKNLRSVTESPCSQTNSYSSAQKSSNESSNQGSDSENTDRNNRPKISNSPSVKRRLCEDECFRNSPGKSKVVSTEEEPFSTLKLDSPLKKINRDTNLKTIQEISDVKDLHPDEVTGSPRRSGRKTNETVSSPLIVGLKSPGKAGNISLNDRLKSLTAEDELQEGQRTKSIMSSPERKTNQGNAHSSKQLLSSKSNPGSPCIVTSSKCVLTPLNKREITVTTPISNKKKGRTLLTPGMPERDMRGRERGGESGEDALDGARRQLHVSTVPRTLPCREQEFDNVRSFLATKIAHGASGCMYISGVPGTGKTATIHAVIRHLQDKADEKELPDFDFVEINGLRLTEPRQAYVRILQSLTDQKRTPDQAQQMLEKRFSRKCRKTTVILVDELDYLCNRRQDVVYNLLEWGASGGGGSGGGGVVVVAVSNTMDLPERALKSRVNSRMGLTRVPFRPYTHKQLQTIVTERLADHPEAFHPDAIQFVARKVAAVSGDARRALDICRRTTELVQPNEQVTVAHVERALAAIFSGPRVQVIRRLGRMAQATLRALRDAAQRTGIDETTVAHAHRQLTSICQLEGLEVPSPGATLASCVSLAGLGLVVAEKRGRPDLLRKICLNVSSDDIHYALDNAAAGL